MRGQGVAGRHRAPVDRGPRGDRVGRDVPEVCRGHRPDGVRRGTCLIAPNWSETIPRAGVQSATAFLAVRKSVVTGQARLDIRVSSGRTDRCVRCQLYPCSHTANLAHPVNPDLDPVTFGRDWPGNRSQNTLIRHKTLRGVPNGHHARDMKRFTVDLRASTKDRKSDLRHIKKATEECLEGTRGLVARIGEAHREMAEQQGLDARRQPQPNSWNGSPPCAGHNQQQIARTRDELRKSLAREMRNLRKSVSSFRTHCRKEQTHLASELRQVAKTWAKMHHHAVELTTIGRTGVRGRVVMAAAPTQVRPILIRPRPRRSRLLNVPVGFGGYEFKYSHRIRLAFCPRITVIDKENCLPWITMT